MHLLSDFRKSRGSVYGILRTGIFGSVARGEQKEGSDVEVIEPEEFRQFLKEKAKKFINDNN